jgi:serine/threonine protein kinase
MSLCCIIRWIVLYDTLLSALQTIAGTPIYMAPELLRGESRPTRESDVYAFGILIYESVFVFRGGRGGMTLRMRWQVRVHPLEELDTTQETGI